MATTTGSLITFDTQSWAIQSSDHMCMFVGGRQLGEGNAWKYCKLNFPTVIATQVASYQLGSVRPKGLP